MPLSPSDVAYINQLLDRHLKYQRSWPRLRYFMLAMSGVIIIMGISTALFSYSMTFQFLKVHAASSRPANTASTTPVTYDALRMSQETSEMQARMDTQILIMFAGFATVGAIFFFVGTHLAGSTLQKWNHHRRDAILITLLREKCTPELSPSPAPQPTPK